MIQPTPGISDLRGTKNNAQSSRVIGVEPGTLQLEVGFGNRGFAVWINDPETARFVADMFLHVAKRLEGDCSIHA